MLRQSIRILYLVIGWTSFALGIVGLFLPVMPTTPFLILTAFCFSKGSERLHTWLLGLPRLGEAIHLWEAHGVIKPRAKIIACITLTLSIGASVLLTDLSWWLKSGLGLIAASALIFITSRPSEPLKKPSAAQNLNNLSH